MGETANRAEMAVRVSDELFGVFGWTRRPLRDENWECVTKRHAKTHHPVDVVFTYDDPLQRVRPYILTDLKSYSKETINWSKIKSALESMAMSVDCAHRSKSFRDLYVEENDNFSVSGMIFIYNSDNLYLKGAQEMLKDVSSKMIGLRAGLRIHVVGPERIDYLRAVANDIHVQRGKKLLPDSEYCGWFYPDLKLSHPKWELGNCATLELLMGPWQILRYEKAGPDQKTEGFHFYYEGPGETIEEFEYLLDCLFQFQLVKKNYHISIRMPNGCSEAMHNFGKAKETYAYAFFPVHDLIRERLKQIGIGRVEKVVGTFSSLDLGLDVQL